jgi:WD40 repeat protein
MSDDEKILVADRATGIVSLVDVGSGDARALSGPRKRAELRDRGTLAMDGRTAAYPEDDDTLTAWDLARGERRTFGKHDPIVSAERLSPDGRLYAEAEDNGAIRVTDTTTGERRKINALDDRGFALTWSGDGRALAAGGRDGTARVYDLAGKELARVRTNAWVWHLAFSRDGARLAVAGMDGAVRVLELPSGQIHELRGHVGSSSAVAFLPDSARLLSGGSDGTVRLWDLRTQRGSIVYRDSSTPDWITSSATSERTMISNGFSGRVWDMGILPGLDAGPDKVAAWAAAQTTAEVSDDGHLRSP